MQKIRVGVITGTRAEYGILAPLMDKISQSKKLLLQVYVTGMHLSEFYGGTKSEISHLVTAEVDMKIKDSNSASDMLSSVSAGIVGFSEAFKANKPDVIVVLGDRIEQYAAAFSALFLGIPIVHLHGGEITGGLDDFLRNMISKMASLHLVATEASEKNLEEMGESKQRIRVVGALGLDSLVSCKEMSREDLARRYGLDENKKWALVIYHPDTLVPAASEEEIKNILEFLRNTEYQKIVIYPNADAGSGPIIDKVNKAGELPDFAIFPSIVHDDFVSIMKHCEFMIGNSSSAIIEAPFLGIPAMNIGFRQAGRQQGTNVINIEHTNEKTLKESLEKLTKDADFKGKVLEKYSPYGEGDSASKILAALEDLETEKSMIIKNPHHRLYHGK